MGFSTTRHSDSFAGAIGEARAASSAGGGTALSTTAALVALPNGTTHVGLIARNFATAVVARFALNPYLLILRTDNGLVAATDYSAAGQQNPATVGAIVLNNLDALANGGALYVGSHLPFRGVSVTMSANVNAIASVLTASYWNGSAWVSLAATDNTSSGGKTLAQTGSVAWTVPAAWAKALLGATVAPAVQYVPYGERPRFWTRWDISAKISAAVQANLALSLNRSTAYAEAPQDSLLQFRTLKGPDGVAALELLTDAGTASAIVNCYTDSPAGTF